MFLCGKTRLIRKSFDFFRKLAVRGVVLIEPPSENIQSGVSTDVAVGVVQVSHQHRELRSGNDVQRTVSICCHTLDELPRLKLPVTNPMLVIVKDVGVVLYGRVNFFSGALGRQGPCTMSGEIRTRDVAYFYVLTTDFLQAPERDFRSSTAGGKMRHTGFVVLVESKSLSTLKDDRIVNGFPPLVERLEVRDTSDNTAHVFDVLIEVEA